MLRARPPNRPWQVARKNSDRDPPGADEALAGGIHSESLDGGAQDRGAGCLEDGIEGTGENRSAIADQESDVLEPLAETDRQVAGLLYCPVAGRVRGDAAEMHPAGAMLDEHQHIQPLQQHGVHVQEIDCQDPCGLGCEELPPGWSRPSRRRINACSAEDLISRCRGRYWPPAPRSLARTLASPCRRGSGPCRGA